MTYIINKANKIVQYLKEISLSKYLLPFLSIIVAGLPSGLK